MLLRSHAAARAAASFFALSLAGLAGACAEGRVDEEPVAGPDGSPVVASPEGGATPGSTGDATAPQSPDAAGPTPVAAPGADAGTGPSPDPDGATPPVPEAGAEHDAPPASLPEASGPPEASTPPGVCPTPAATALALPFAVDSNFIASGFEGDRANLSLVADPTCGGHRSSAGALGSCHPVTYEALPPAGATLGWAGVLWQHPADNWGTSPGFLIPAGARTVSFWARGGAGGEVVSFLVGGIGFGKPPTVAAPCADTVSSELSHLALTTTWTQYTISLDGQTYPNGVIAAFGFVLAATDQPAAGAGAPDGGPAVVSFAVDDIEWR